jgi:DNA primase
VFINSAFGFVRGLLSMARYKWKERGDQMASIFETVELVNKLLEVDAVDVPTDMDKIKFISQTNNGIKQAKIIGKIPKQQVRSQLEFPAKYLTNRGFSPQVLDRYDVGLCNNRTKEMYQRIVVPIYDDSGQYMVGCTCRSIYEKCPLCKLWHNPKIPCPQKWHEHMFSKWKHSGFKRDFHLYNSWFACKHIQMTNQVIVVESPGNVWKLEEAGIHNSVAIFGTYISKQQTGLLNKMGAMYVTVIGDNDKAGDTMCEIIQKNKMWKVERIKVPQGYDDLGDMPINKITELLKEKNDV